MPDNSRYRDILDFIKELSLNPTDEGRQALFELSQPQFLIAKSSDGRIVIHNGEVMFDNKPAEPFVAKRLLTIIEHGLNPEPLYQFMVNLDLNPSYHSVQQLYRFMEANDMAITTTGMILAYKRVTDKYLDIYTETFDNSVGTEVKIPRNQVNDNPHQTCSNGLHVCSMGYLPHYGSRGGNRVVICEINPQDVVSVPDDYHNAKMRVCRYQVVGEVADTKGLLNDDLLKSSPVIDFSKDDYYEYDFEDDPTDGVDTVIVDFNEALREHSNTVIDTLNLYYSDEPETGAPYDTSHDWPIMEYYDVVGDELAKAFPEINQPLDHSMTIREVGALLWQACS
jgi:hypothetical protein